MSVGSFCFFDVYIEPSTPDFSYPICNEFTGSPSQMWIIDGKKTLIVSYGSDIAIDKSVYFVSVDKTDPSQQWIIQEA